MTEATENATTENAAEAAAPAAAPPSEGAAPAAAASAEPAQAAPTRPEGLPDDFWDDATGLKVGDLVAAFRDMKAAEAARLADVPQGDATYELKVSEAVENPDGFEIELNADDPFLKTVSAELKAAGVPQAAFQKLADAYATAQIEAQKQVVADLVKANEALGENREARIKALTDYAGVNLPQREAAILAEAIKTAPDLVPVFERLMKAKADPTAAQPGAGAKTTQSFEGLRGADRLAAIRSQAA